MKATDIKGFQFKPGRVPHYIGTFPNTPESRDFLKSVRSVLKIVQYKVACYGRGPRKQIFQERAKDPNSWEYGKKWSTYYNHQYRPKMKDCTHFDAYAMKSRGPYNSY